MCPKGIHLFDHVGEMEQERFLLCFLHFSHTFFLFRRILEILTILGDLPHKDAKPERNVLFVCQLNPITTEEDLEVFQCHSLSLSLPSSPFDADVLCPEKVIFSRFGNIISCEIIKDWKTGDSLQYAFIEFETEDEVISSSPHTHT